MVRVVPFRAYRYNKEKIKDLSKVVAPPYDIIKGEKVDEIQSLSNFNIAWVIKNKALDNDTESHNQYTRARDYLTSWIEDEILIRDESECFYVYGQDFEVGGKNLFRFGFIGLMELEEFAKTAPSEGTFSGVLQHEETLPKDIIDRLSLCRETMANFGQIFVIYPDHEGQVDAILEESMKNNPDIDLTDYENVRHRIWRISSKEKTKEISRLMENKYVIIADGHHRYKTALQLSKENPDLESAKYRMLTFVNISNPGLVVLPTHRLVQHLDNFDGESLLNQIKNYFDLETFSDKDSMFAHMKKMFENGKHTLGLFIDDGYFYALTLQDLTIMREVMPDSSDELRNLDVSVLHALVLDKMLGIDKEKLKQGTMKGGGFITYLKGIGDAVEESINSVKGEAQAVFFMNPTKVEEVEAVSKNFEVMPQKSTFFQPKVWTGFTINKLTN
ncbi:MAG: DUF1015 domain-containing protein [Candidatus Thorarchaeota archaeon]